MSATFQITHPGGLTVPEVTNDPDVILQAWEDGFKLERVPAPVSACGCPRCERTAEVEEKLGGLETGLQGLSEGAMSA